MVVEKETQEDRQALHEEDEAADMKSREEEQQQSAADDAAVGAFKLTPSALPLVTRVLF